MLSKRTGERNREFNEIDAQDCGGGCRIVPRVNPVWLRHFISPESRVLVSSFLGVCVCVRGLFVNSRVSPVGKIIKSFVRLATNWRRILTNKIDLSLSPSEAIPAATKPKIRSLSHRVCVSSSPHQNTICDLETLLHTS